MKHRLFFSWLLCSILGFAFVAAQATAAPNLTATAKAFMNEVLEVAKASKQTGGKADATMKAKVRGLSERVDFEGLARLSLGSARWAKQKPVLRERFRASLQELLELVVYPRAQELVVDSDNMLFSEVKGKPQQVRVFAKIQRERRGEIVAEDLELILTFNKNKNPLVVDTIMDGEAISANLKRQFDRALEKQSFEQIVQKIEKRVQEARADAQKLRGSADASKKS